MFTVDHSRSGSAGASGAPNRPAIDFDAYRLKAARMRAQDFRHFALAIRAGLVNAARWASRAVIPFTHAQRDTCNKTLPGSDLPLAVYEPRLLRANDNSVPSRRSESA